jgi:hypothetical protein
MVVYRRCEKSVGDVDSRTSCVWWFKLNAKFDLNYYTADCPPKGTGNKSRDLYSTPVLDIRFEGCGNTCAKDMDWNATGKLRTKFLGN